LVVSVWRFRQARPHAVSPVGQLHAPEMHVAPIGQTRPQVPQLFTSVAVSTQVPAMPPPAPQMMSLPGHVHAPAMHVAPIAQT
jgi:hypothetical protein